MLRTLIRIQSGIQVRDHKDRVLARIDPRFPELHGFLPVLHFLSFVRGSLISNKNGNRRLNCEKFDVLDLTVMLPLVVNRDQTAVYTGLVLVKNRIIFK